MGAKCSLILPSLYLGGVSATDPESLKHYGINASLSLGPDAPNESDGVKVLQHKIADIPTQNLLSLLASGVEFILERRLAGDTILVHCQAGISRSTTFLAAYFMTVYNFNLDETLVYIEKCRSCVNPNYGFRRQLEQFQLEERDCLRQRLLREYGSQMEDLIDDDLSIIQKFSKGEERLFDVENIGEHPRQYLSLHSSQTISDLLKLAIQGVGLSGGMDVYLLDRKKGRAVLPLNPKYVIGEIPELNRKPDSYETRVYVRLLQSPGPKN